MSIPSARITRPKPVRIHQPAWLAAGSPDSSEPWIRDVTTEPMTATPSVWPTWRLVEATAAATPACARGMPVTAVLVIGGLSEPNPMPRMA